MNFFQLLQYRGHSKYGPDKWHYKELSILLISLNVSNTLNLIQYYLYRDLFNYYSSLGSNNIYDMNIRLC